MSTFVLVHGAWHGAWCWYKVAPLLKKKGHTVIVPDLPGHGIDRTPLGDVTLQRYADRVCEILDASREPVVLVGHSMGGFVISQAAELRPQKVKHLVYLAAVLVDNGTALYDYMQTGGSEKLRDGIVMAEDQGSMTLRPGIIRESFYADCSDEDVALAGMLLTPQPVSPFMVPLKTTPGNWGQIPRHYIECLQDRAIPIERQRHSHRQLPCKSVISMDASHSPFFSAPDELADHLVAL